MSQQLYNGRQKKQKPKKQQQQKNNFASQGTEWINGQLYLITSSEVLCLWSSTY
jgi:hypothetical protein